MRHVALGSVYSVESMQLMLYININVLFTRVCTLGQLVTEEQTEGSTHNVKHPAPNVQNRKTNPNPIP